MIRAGIIPLAMSLAGVLAVLVGAVMKALPAADESSHWLILAIGGGDRNAGSMNRYSLGPHTTNPTTPSHQPGGRKV